MSRGGISPHPRGDDNAPVRIVVGAQVPSVNQTSAFELECVLGMEGRQCWIREQGFTGLVYGEVARPLSEGRFTLKVWGTSILYEIETRTVRAAGVAQCPLHAEYVKLAAAMRALAAEGRFR